MGNAELDINDYFDSLEAWLNSKDPDTFDREGLWKSIIECGKYLSALLGTDASRTNQEKRRLSLLDICTHKYFDHFYAGRHFEELPGISADSQYHKRRFPRDYFNALLLMESEEGKALLNLLINNDELEKEDKRARNLFYLILGIEAAQFFELGMGYAGSKSAWSDLMPQIQSQCNVALNYLEAKNHYNLAERRHDWLLRKTLSELSSLCYKYDFSSEGDGDTYFISAKEYFPASKGALLKGVNWRLACIVPNPRSSEKGEGAYLHEYIAKLESAWDRSFELVLNNAFEQVWIVCDYEMLHMASWEQIESLLYRYNSMKYPELQKNSRVTMPIYNRIVFTSYSGRQVAERGDRIGPISNKFIQGEHPLDGDYHFKYPEAEIIHNLKEKRGKLLSLSEILDIVKEVISRRTEVAENEKPRSKAKTTEYKDPMERAKKFIGYLKDRNFLGEIKGPIEPLYYLKIGAGSTLDDSLQNYLDKTRLIDTRTMERLLEEILSEIFAYQSTGDPTLLPDEMRDFDRSDHDRILRFLKILSLGVLERERLIDSDLYEVECLEMPSRAVYSIPPEDIRESDDSSISRQKEWKPDLVWEIKDKDNVTNRLALFEYEFKKDDYYEKLCEFLELGYGHSVYINYAFGEQPPANLTRKKTGRIMFRENPAPAISPSFENILAKATIVWYVKLWYTGFSINRITAPLVLRPGESPKRLSPRSDIPTGVDPRDIFTQGGYEANLG